MSRYARADLLRPREDLNIKSGLSWLQAAQKRYAAPIAPPDYVGLGYVVDTAPSMTSGVDTLMHVGDLGYAGESLLRPLAALGAAYWSYERNNGDPLWTLIWGALAYWQPMYTGVGIAALSFVPGLQGVKIEKMLGGMGGHAKRHAKRLRKNPGRKRARRNPTKTKSVHTMKKKVYAMTYSELLSERRRLLAKKSPPIGSSEAKYLALINRSYWSRRRARARRRSRR